MKRLRTLFLAGLGLALAGTASAAGGGKHPDGPEGGFPFEGPLGKFEMDSVQRGFQVYREVCSSCHGLKLLSYRNLGEPGGPFYDPAYPNPNDNPQVKAIAEQDMVVDATPDEFGDPVTRPARPSDNFKQPFANEQMARAANNGAYPPDFSVIVKARKGGPEYIRSLMLGYDYEPPEDLDIRPGLYYNPYFPGGLIAMPPQLREGIIEYSDGTAATPEQMAHDVVSFLTWVAEPHMEARKRMGLMVMIYLTIFAILLWLAYRQVWSNVKH